MTIHAAKRILLNLVATLALLPGTRVYAGVCNYLVSPEVPRRIEFDDIVPNTNIDWTPVNPDLLKFGHHEGKYWLKAVCLNDSSLPLGIVLTLKYATLDKVIFYDDHGSILGINGDKTPNNRSLDYRHPSVLVTLEPDSGQTIYIEIETDGSYTFPVKELPQKRFMNKIQNEYLLYGSFVGIVLAGILLSAILYSLMKSAIYLYYMGYVASLSLWILSNRGVAHDYLWNALLDLGMIWLPSNVMPLLVFPSVYCFIAFSRRFLLLESYIPWLNRLFCWLEYSVLATGAISLFFSYKVINLAGVFLTVGYSPLIIYAAYMVSFRVRYQPSRFYFVGLSIFLLSAINAGFLDQELIGRNLFTENLLVFSFITEIVSMSYGLAIQFKMWRENSERISREKEGLARLLRLAQSIAHDLKAPFREELRFLNDLREKRQLSLADVGTAIDNLTVKYEVAERSLQDIINMAPDNIASRTQVDLKGALDQALLLVNKNGIKIDVNLSHSHHIFVNYMRLVHSIYNLVINAIEAGSKKLIISSSDQQGHVELVVANSAAYIPPERLRRIWTEQYTTKKGGNGLGLTIVKTFVEEAGGNIKCHSDQLWTTFTLSFPAGEVITLAPVPEKIQGMEPRHGPIVFIDDDPVTPYVQSLDEEHYYFSNIDDFIDSVESGALDIEAVKLIVVDRFIHRTDVVGISFPKACRDLGYKGDVWMMSDSFDQNMPSPFDGFQRGLPKTNLVNALTEAPLP